MKKILNLSLCSIAAVSLALTGFKNNDSSNGYESIIQNGILPKKVIRIEKFVSNLHYTYIFDTNGNVVSVTQISSSFQGNPSEEVVDTVDAHFSYTSNTIVGTRNDTTIMTVKLAKGKVVSGNYTDTSFPDVYRYNSGGYLSSRIETKNDKFIWGVTNIHIETKYSVKDGNINTYKKHSECITVYNKEGDELYMDRNDNLHTVHYRSGEKVKSERIGTGIVTFDNELLLNNLNVDISLLLVDGIFDSPAFYFSGYYGKRNKNLPTSINYNEIFIFGGEDYNEGEVTSKFNYTYEGEYLTAIQEVKGSNDIIYEIYYEE